MPYRSAAGGGGGISSYARGATLVVAASDSKDTTDADYVCDGTDDQTEINNAISALPSSGGRVLLLEGTYNISASISILADNVTLAGQGNGTKLFLVNGANTHVIQIGNASTTLEGITIRDLQIDGNTTNQTATSHGIYFYGGSGKITKSAVLSCYVHDCYTYGIYLVYSDNNTVTGNQANSGSNGIRLYYSNNNTVTGNQANSDTFGIYLSDSNNNTVTGNQANSGSVGGIYISYSDNNTVTGNQANSGGSGIYLNAADYNTIVGNGCQGNSDYGINVSNSTSDNNLIANNYLTGNTTAGINDAGTGTTLFGNIE